MGTPSCDRRHSRRHPASFTLVELMIVIAVLLIIALLVLPTAGDDEASTLNMAARLVMADIEYAQLQSIGNAENPCMIVFNTGNNSYFLSRLSAPATPITDPGTNTPYVVQFGQGAAAGLGGVTIDSIHSDGGSQLQFDSSGIPNSVSPPVITLRLDSDTLQITVDPSTGEPSVP